MSSLKDQLSTAGTEPISFINHQEMSKAFKDGTLTNPATGETVTAYDPSDGKTHDTSADTTDPKAWNKFLQDHLKRDANGSFAKSADGSFVDAKTGENASFENWKYELLLHLARRDVRERLSSHCVWTTSRMEVVQTPPSWMHVTQNCPPLAPAKDFGHEVYQDLKPQRWHAARDMDSSQRHRFQCYRRQQFDKSPLLDILLDKPANEMPGADAADCSLPNCCRRVEI